MATPQLTTKSKDLNVFADNEVDFGRISAGKTLATDLDFKFQEGDVTIHKLVHYHNGIRAVLGEQLAGLVTATAAESSRAQAAESKIASDLSSEAKWASDEEAVITQSVTAKVTRASTAEGLAIS